MNQTRFAIRSTLWLFMVVVITILVSNLSGVPAQAEAALQATDEPTATNTPVPVPTVNFARTVTPVSEKNTVRIGYQRNGLFLLLKNQELLEKRFGPNVTVT